MITSEDLINIIENDSTESSIKHIAENLLEAINDWPIENLCEPNELISELKKHINGKLTFENIKQLLKTLNAENNAWKMESLHSILKIFSIVEIENADGEMELEMIMVKITN